MTEADIALSTVRESRHSQSGKLTPVRSSIWMLFSVAAILVAATALGMAIYALCSLVFGVTEVRLAIGQVGAYPIKAMSKAPGHVQTLFFVLLSVLFFCLAAPVFGAAIVAARRNWRERLAMRPFTLRPGMIAAIALFVAMPVYLIGASFAIRFVDPTFTTWFFVPPHATGLALSFLGVAIMAPLAEELLFRGWIQTGLLKGFRPATAILITTLLFALAHFNGSMLYPAAIFIPGLTLALVRQWTGSVWASFAAHAVYNAWAWVLMLIIGKDLV